MSRELVRSYRLSFGPALEKIGETVSLGERFNAKFVPFLMDPMAAVKAARESPRMGVLCERMLRHLPPGIEDLSDLENDRGMHIGAVAVTARV